MNAAATLKKLVFEVELDNSQAFQTHRRELDPFFKKFLELKSAIARALKKYLPVEVVQKKPPSHYHQVSQAKGNNMFLDTRRKKIVHFPRVGSFQITVDDFVVFSRLQTGEWPIIPLILEWAVIVAEKLIDIQLTRQTRAVQNLQLSLNMSPRAEMEELPHLINGNQTAKAAEPITDRLPTRQSHNNERIAKPIQSPENEDKANLKQTQGNQIASSAEEELPQITHRSDRYVDPASPTINPTKMDNIKKYQYLNRTLEIPNTRERSRKQKFTWRLDLPLNLGIKPSQKLNSKDVQQTRTAWRNSILLQPLPSEPDTERQYEEDEEELTEGAPTMSIEEDLKEEQPIKKLTIKISQSLLNINRRCYEVDNDKITKIDNDGIWSPLLFESPLPLQGQYYFAIAISSQHNRVHLGIVPLNYYPKSQENDDQDLFISYSASDGLIKDSLQIQSQQYTRWRKGGLPAPFDRNYQVRVVINMEAKVVDWYIDETIVGSAKLTKHYAKGFRPFISLNNIQDQAVANQQSQMPLQKDSFSTEDPNRNKLQNNKKERLATRRQLIEMIDEEIQTSRIKGTIRKQKLLSKLDRQLNLQENATKNRQQQSNNHYKLPLVANRNTITPFQSPFEQFYGSCQRQVGIVYAKPSKMNIIPKIQSQREKNRQWAEREINKYRELKNMRLTSINPLSERPTVRRSALK